MFKKEKKKESYWYEMKLGEAHIQKEIDLVAGKSLRSNQNRQPGTQKRIGQSQSSQKV